MTYKKIALIGAQLGWGAQKHETEWGPQLLQSHALDQHLRQQRIPVYWRDTVRCLETYQSSVNSSTTLSAKQKLENVIAFNQQLASVTAQCITEKVFPVVIGGDHAIAMGTWSGVVHALNAYQDFGLIWIDAHFDAHVPETSPSGAYHGMPVAHLLGHGEKRLTSLLSEHPKLNPNHLIYIGIRSFEPEEQALIQDLGIKVYNMSAVNARDFAAVFNEALDDLTKRVSHLGITLDLDALDPQDAPGVGTPEQNGLRAEAVLSAFTHLGKHPKLRAFEIAEFNPTLDVDGQTERLIENLLSAFFA